MTTVNTKKATKKELMAEIAKLHSQYVGFEVDKVYGLASKTIDQLKTEVAEIKRAVRFNNYAKKIKVDMLKGYFAPPDSEMGEKYIRRSIIGCVATDIWHKKSYDEAKKHARSNFYDFYEVKND